MADTASPEVLDRIARTVQSLDSSIAGLNQGFGALLTTLGQISNGMQGAANGANNVGNGVAGANRQAQSLDQTLNSWISKFLNANNLLTGMGTTLGAAWRGAKAGFQNLITLSSQFLGVIETISTSLLAIGTSILLAPLHIFDGLIKKAMEFEEVIYAIAEAIQNSVDKFGDLSVGIGKAASAMDAGGFSVGGIFGMRGEFIEWKNEVLSSMGPIADIIQGNLKTLGKSLVYFSKGLGLSGEQIGDFNIRARMLGKDFGKTNDLFINVAKTLQKKFGLSVKQVGKDLALAAKDVVHFGLMTEKEIGVAITYSRKLGVELGKIVGVMDAFGDFDQAAESVAKLSGVFGTHIDVMKMVKAQNPQEMIDELRNSLFATGRSFDTMTRQEKKYLASLTGLDDQTAAQVFSMNNMGKSLADVQKEMEDNDPTRQMSKGIKELSKDIKQLVYEMGQGGFVERFFGGFSKGLTVFGPMRGFFMEIAKSLHDVHRIGMKVGQSFDMIAKYGITKLFNLDSLDDATEKLQEFQEYFIGKMKSFFTNFGSDFDKFFIDLFDDPEKAVSNFIRNIKKSFGMSFLFGDDEAGKKKRSDMILAIKTMFSGFKKVILGFLKDVPDLIEEAKIELFGENGLFGKTDTGDLIKSISKDVATVLGAVGKFIVTNLTTIALEVADFLKNGFSGTQSAAGLFIKDNFWDPLKAAFGDTKILTDLKAALWTLFGAIWDKAKEIGGQIFDNWGMYIAAIVFGPAVIQGVIAGAIPLLTTLFGGLLGAAQRITQTAGIAGTTGATAAQVQGVDWKSIAKVFGVAIVAIGAVALLLPLYFKYISWIGDDLTQEDIIKGGLILGIAAGIVVMSAKAAEAISGVDLSKLKGNIWKFLGAAAIIGTVGAGLFSVLGGLIEGVLALLIRIPIAMFAGLDMAAIGKMGVVFVAMLPLFQALGIVADAISKLQTATPASWGSVGKLLAITGTIVVASLGMMWMINSYLRSNPMSTQDLISLGVIVGILAVFMNSMAVSMVIVAAALWVLAAAQLDKLAGQAANIAIGIGAIFLATGAILGGAYLALSGMKMETFTDLAAKMALVAGFMISFTVTLGTVALAMVGLAAAGAALIGGGIVSIIAGGTMVAGIVGVFAFIQNLINETQKLDIGGSGVDDLKKKADLISVIIDPVYKLGGFISSLIDKIKGFNTEKISIIGNFIKDIVQSTMFDSIESFMKALMLIGITEDQLSKISKVAEVVSKLVDPIIGMTNGLVSLGVVAVQKSKSVDDLKQNINSIKKLFEIPVDLMASIVPFINSLKGVSLDKTTLDTITGVSGVIGTIGQVISSFGKVFTDLKQSTESGIFDQWKNFVTGTSEEALEASRTGNRMNDLMAALNNIVSSVFVGEGGKESMIKKIIGAFKVEFATEADLGMIEKNTKIIETVFTSVEKAMRYVKGGAAEIKNINDSYNEFPRLLTQLINNGRLMKDKINSDDFKDAIAAPYILLKSFDDKNKEIEELGTGENDPIKVYVKSLEKLNASLKSLNDAGSKFEAIDIQMNELEKISQALSANAKIQLDLAIHINGDRLTHAVLESGRVVKS